MRSSSQNPKSASRPIILMIAAGTILAWALFALLVVPALIRSAWAGESVGFLNAAIEGRDVHPASFYVGLWYRAALLLTAVLAALAAAGAVACRTRAAWLPRASRMVRATPAIGWTPLLALGITAGALAGLAEAVPIVVRATLIGDPREAPAPELIWMAPLAAAMAGFAFTGLLGLLLRARRGISLRLPAFVLSVAVFFTLFGALRIGLHRYAVLLLAVGLASLVAPAIARRPQTILVSAKLAAAAIALPIVGGVLMGLLAGVGGGGRAGSSAGGDPRPPNVLFLILDTVRARSLSLYGYERQTTPELSRWLADGVVFDNAIAPTPWTLPSHASMFTGLEPHALSTDFDRALDDAEPTLAETLRERGYSTAAFVANLIYTTRLSGLDRGFATYADHPVSLRALLSSSRWTRQPAERVRALLGHHGALVRVSAEDINREFLDWLDGRPDGPFFAFLNYFDAHSPYETHSPFDTLFADASPRYWLMKGWQRSYTEEELREFIDAYDSAIAYLDHQIGVLLEELERRGTLENTLLVIVGDHGESLGENDILIHANSLYMPQLRVPLGIRLPGRIPAGRRVTAPAGLGDLPATVLETAGIQAEMPGRSLASMWNADQGDTGSDDGIYSELTYNRFAHRDDPIQKGLMRSIVRGRWHYILNGDGSEELYDLTADPDESSNLTGIEAGDSVLPALQRALRAHLDAGAATPARQ